jgi:hypothetical protein
MTLVLNTLGPGPSPTLLVASADASTGSTERMSTAKEDNVGRLVPFWCAILG